MEAPNNKNMCLTPRTVLSCRVLNFAFLELLVGVAQYDEGPTGCTLFHFPRGVDCVVDIQGGSPGMVLIDQSLTGESRIDGVCFAGSSIYGLEAIAGATTKLFEQAGYPLEFARMARISGAVIYDFRPRANAVYADRELGRAAAGALRTGTFPLGRCGAGCSASVGKGPDNTLWEFGGQGAAYRQIGQVHIAVFTVVNAVGAIVDRAGRVVRGHFLRDKGMRLSAVEEVERRLPSGRGGEELGGNTTLTLLATNQKLTSFQLRQLSKQVHSSMARAIQPFHTWRDGDCFFAVTTQEVDGGLDATDLGIVSSELAWDAVLSSFDPD